MKLLNEPLVIDINLDDDAKSSNILGGLIELSNTKPLGNTKKRKQPKAIEPEYDEEQIMITSLLNKEKKEKKKNKSMYSDIREDLLTSNNVGASLESTQNALVEMFGDIDDDDLIDLDDIEYERDEDIEGDIIDVQKRGYKKLKSEENPFKKEFAEELTLYYNLLSEINDYGKDMEKELKALNGSKVRGSAKYKTDLTELVLTSKQSKLNVLKEIVSVKKTIADLKIKVDDKAAKKASDEKSGPEFLASAYFKNMLNHGRNNFINEMGVGSMVNDEPRDTLGAMQSGIMEDDYVSDDYNDILEERLASDGNQFRSEEGNAYIKYENLGMSYRIDKCIDTNEWSVVAVSKAGDIIPDYPLPTRASMGRVKFSLDGTYASDSKGRNYAVRNYSLDEYEDDIPETTEY